MKGTFESQNVIIVCVCMCDVLVVRMCIVEAHNLIIMCVYVCVCV
jgi:hypothetical protein